MTDHAHPFKRLTEAEARRALYIDFEGQKDKPPVLLGVHRHGRGSRPFVHQVVMDQAFASLCGSVMSLREAVEKVVLRADHGDRRIVSWSVGKPTYANAPAWERGAYDEWATICIGIASTLESLSGNDLNGNRRFKRDRFLTACEMNA